MQAGIFSSHPDPSVTILTKLTDILSHQAVFPGNGEIFVKLRGILGIIVDPAEVGSNPHTALPVLENSINGIVRNGIRVAGDMMEMERFATAPDVQSVFGPHPDPGPPVPADIMHITGFLAPESLHRFECMGADIEREDTSAHCSYQQRFVILQEKACEILPGRSCPPFIKILVHRSVLRVKAEQAEPQGCKPEIAFRIRANVPDNAPLRRRENRFGLPGGVHPEKTRVCDGDKKIPLPVKDHVPHYTGNRRAV
jgi:hypothetical protein